MTPRRRAASPAAPQRGQGLVEFAMLVPVFVLLLLGMLEFGFVFDHTMTLGYATREGARSGAAFGGGNTTHDALRATSTSTSSRPSSAS